MRLYVDTNTREILDDQYATRKLTTIPFTRGDTQDLELVFLNENGAITTLATPYQIKFGIKNKDDFYGDFLVYEDAFTLDGNIYKASPNFNTLDLNALLTGTTEYVDAMLEIELTANTKKATTVPTLGRIYNDVIKGDEDPPTEGNPSYVTEAALNNETVARIAGDATNMPITGTTGSVLIGSLSVTDSLTANNDLTNPLHLLNKLQIEAKMLESDIDQDNKPLRLSMHSGEIDYIEKKIWCPAPYQLYGNMNTSWTIDSAGGRKGCLKITATSAVDQAYQVIRLGNNASNDDMFDTRKPCVMRWMSYNLDVECMFNIGHLWMGLDPDVSANIIIRVYYNYTNIFVHDTGILFEANKVYQMAFWAREDTGLLSTANQVQWWVKAEDGTLLGESKFNSSVTFTTTGKKLFQLIVQQQGAITPCSVSIDDILAFKTSTPSIELRPSL